jgi:hypothetical protein
MTDYNHLFELHDLAIKDVQKYPQKRELYNHLGKFCLAPISRSGGRI